MLGDYLIDRTEVTNRQFKRFVDEGGYRRRELWKEPFVHAGKTLGWDQAMALLHDRTGRPGPATWDRRRLPRRAGRPPGHRDQLVRGRGLRCLRRQAAPQRVPVEPRRRDVPDAEHRSCEQLPERRHGCGRDARGHRSYGTEDMAGNAKEWCWNPLKDGRRFVLGGGWNEPSYMFNDADAQDPFTRGVSFGFRLVKHLDARTAPEASGPIPLAHRDYASEKPASPEVAQAYLPGLRVRPAPARRPGGGDRRQRGPLAQGEGQLHCGVRGRARRRISPDPARRAPTVPGGRALPRARRDPRALEQDPSGDAAAVPDPPERARGAVPHLQVDVRAR